jgi:hypothetical protein
MEAFPACPKRNNPKGWQILYLLEFSLKDGVGR